MPGIIDTSHTMRVIDEVYRKIITRCISLLILDERYCTLQDGVTVHMV